MKKSEVKEIKNKSVERLQKDLQDAREKLSELEFKLAVGKATNVSKIREIKKKIARILTVINNK